MQDDMYLDEVFESIVDYFKKTKGSVAIKLHAGPLVLLCFCGSFSS